MIVSDAISVKIIVKLKLAVQMTEVKYFEIIFETGAGGGESQFSSLDVACHAYFFFIHFHIPRQMG